MEEIGEKSPAQWAIDILVKDYQYEQKFYNKYLGELMLGFAGVTIPWMKNYLSNRPLYAGLQYHIAFGLIGAALGRVLTLSTDHYYAKRDAILLDYVKKHPDRFPEPPNRKYADILQPWYPLR